MVQPALVVADSHGRVVYWWSWSRLRSGRIAADNILPNERRSADNADGNTHDVRWRPVPADLLARLTGVGGELVDLRVENLGFPDRADHVNVKRRLRRNPADEARRQLAAVRKTGEEAHIFRRLDADEKHQSKL